MPLQISKREREGVQVFDMTGRLVAGEDVGVFRNLVVDLGAEEKQMVVLNLKDVDYIDSTGLGAMVMAATQLKRTAGVTKLLNLNRRNLELLVLTKINTMFEVFDDEIEAVNSFFPGREIRKFDILSFVRGLKEE